MCALYVEMMCAGRIGLNWAHDVFIVVCQMLMHFSCIRTLFFLSYWYWSLLVLFCLSPPSLSLSRLIALWHLNVSLLHPETFFISGHLLLILHPLTFGSMMRRLVRTSRRTFRDTTFIQNAKSSYQTFPILTFPLSSTVGVGSHFVASRSLLPLWSYKSFTLTWTDLIIMYLISSLAFEVRTL